MSDEPETGQGESEGEFFPATGGNGIYSPADFFFVTGVLEISMGCSLLFNIML